MGKNAIMYKYTYKTPKAFSDIIMNSDGKFLTALWFEGSKSSVNHNIDCEEKELPIFKETSRWLDCYFDGKVPDFIPQYKINHSTPFREEVLEILKTIDYGQTMTYSEISKIIAKNRD